MTALRFALGATAWLAGIYAAVMWAMCMLTSAGIAGAIAGAALIAAECIRYCTRRQQERAEAMQRHPSVWTLPLGTEASFWDLPAHWPDGRAVWPSEAGAPE